MPVRNLVLSHRIDRTAQLKEIVSTYHSTGCDGLLLSHITKTTVRMPVRQILHSLLADRQFVDWGSTSQWIAVGMHPSLRRASKDERFGHSLHK